MNQSQLVRLLYTADVPVEDCQLARGEISYPENTSSPHGKNQGAIVNLVGGVSHKIDGFRRPEKDDDDDHDGFVIARLKNESNGFVALIPEHVVSVWYSGAPG